MNEQNRKLLRAIVRAALAEYSERFVEQKISRAHNGRPEVFVTMENQYLFRQYRNSVSGDARELILEAKLGS